jgi:hypothetical protein
MDRCVTLRWIDVDNIIGESLLAEAFNKDTLQATKDKALTKLGIARAEEEKPLTAWLRAMAEENGLPVAVPAVAELRRAVEESAGAMRFVFWLA